MEKKEPLLKIDNIYYLYPDGTKALNGIDLVIEKGKKVAFLGANGSGKSTFFLCLNGIYKPSKGTLYWKGVPFSYSKKALLELRSKVGIVFQDPDNQLFSSSVYEEISFGILNLGVTEQVAKEKVEFVMEQFQIIPFRGKPTYALSGGQKKQVSIADIVVMQPEIIILDEPAAALDPIHTELLYKMIDELIKQGITVLVSTHSVDFALQWADEVVLFQEGTVLIKGSPEIVFSNLTVLEKTNLKQPEVLQVFERLCKKEILKSNLPMPKNFFQLEQYIEAIHTINMVRGTKMEGQGKKAILIVSFGTSYHNTRKETIDKIEEEIEKAYPTYAIYHAWTSKMIIKKLWNLDRIKINTVSEAMEQMKLDQVQEVIIQPTHIMNGIENDCMKEEALAYQNSFETIRFGTPLLTTEEDNIEVIQALMREFPILSKKEVLVFMGHGTTHYANAVYAALDYQIKEKGYSNVFIGTVEAYPSMETIIKLVKEYNPNKVILAPFMIVAGIHAIHDMASDRPDSWRHQFEQAGFQVQCVIKGIGAYKGIQQIFIRHIAQALEN